ncbi:M23 family metallopeptidase [bacterium]|nr:M23 family metallopeptidase [bacterium]MBU1916642.1 M23 family metallopeptidase [bacterium]
MMCPPISSPRPPMSHLPVNLNDLPGFASFVRVNPFQRETHNGYDFGAYRKKDDTFVLGLPPAIPVRPMAPGIIDEVLVDYEDGFYHQFVTVRHGPTLTSTYVHIQPTHGLKKGDAVGAHSVLGKLVGLTRQASHKPAEIVRSIYPHLHFTIERQGSAINPKDMVSFRDAPFHVAERTRLEFPGFDAILCNRDLARPFLEQGLLTYEPRWHTFLLNRKP